MSLDLSRTIFARIRLNYVWVSWWLRSAAALSPRHHTERPFLPASVRFTGPACHLYPMDPPSACGRLRDSLQATLNCAGAGLQRAHGAAGSGCALPLDAGPAAAVGGGRLHGLQQRVGRLLLPAPAPLPQAAAGDARGGGAGAVRRSSLEAWLGQNSSGTQLVPAGSAWYVIWLQLCGGGM